MKFTKAIVKEDILDLNVINKINGLEFHEDEIFVKVRHKGVLYDRYYISNYSKLISLCGKIPKIITPYINKINKRYRCTIWGNDKSKYPYIYQLVAEAFCVQPSNPNNEKTNIHHIHKYDENKSIEENDRADNLIILQESDHKTLDILKELRITYLPSIITDFETGELLYPPIRKTISEVSLMCEELNIDINKFIEILKENPKYIGETAETHYYNRNLINVVKYKPRINKKLKIDKCTQPRLTTLDRW